MDLEKISYPDLLRYIDILRSQGIPDNHPDMIKARRKLRDFLELNKEKSTSIVPTIKSIKTITLNQAPEEKGFNKFVLLGIAFALAAILYKFKTARIGMNAQSIAHIMIFVFILIGNIGYFATKAKDKKV